MKRASLLGFIILFLCVACTVQETHLVYRPEPTAEATTVPTASPTPQVFSVPEVTGEPERTDANGIPIRDPLNHYFDTYVTLSEIRIYPYEQGMFLDGILTNSFQQTLRGGLRITFRGEDGILYGYGDLYTVGGGLTVLPGENRIYADLLTEVDVQTMDFTVEVIGKLAPEP
ncbi:MAG: hypothetical protein IJK01_10415 [Clostridia bacterium]|nr:hypothetical protein [Clostridia bacterium]